MFPSFSTSISPALLLLQADCSTVSGGNAKGPILDVMIRWSEPLLQVQDVQAWRGDVAREAGARFQQGPAL